VEPEFIGAGGGPASNRTSQTGRPDPALITLDQTNYNLEPSTYPCNWENTKA
ncbi:hypothetical protein LINPERHAP1_LOCUS25972, partial [Linum perenne]